MSRSGYQYQIPDPHLLGCNSTSLLREGGDVAIARSNMKHHSAMEDEEDVRTQCIQIGMRPRWQ